MNTIETIEDMQKDIRNLKLKAFEPDKDEAEAVLNYLSWEEGEAKTNFEISFRKELSIINEWLEVYCKEYHCNREKALENVIYG